MKKIISILLFVICYVGYSQDNDINKRIYTTEIVKQANDMANAFIKEDYKSFVKFLHPKFIQAVGGENKMEKIIEKSISQAKNQGISFLNITFDNPTKIVKSNKELQCTIVQHLTAKTKNGSVMNSSTLIAISIDNGKKWYFIDTTNKDIKQIRQLLPDLSPEIVIQKKS